MNFFKKWFQKKQDKPEKKELINEDLFHLAYISFSTQLFDIDDEKTGIKAILEKSRANNSKRGITGMLLYRDGVFLQILEGPYDEIMNTFGRIACDGRHEGCKILVRQKTDKRLFENWSMAYREFDYGMADAFEVIMPWKQMIEDTKTGKVIKHQKIIDIFMNYLESVENDLAA